MGKTRTVYTPELLKDIEELAGKGYPYTLIEEELGLKPDSIKKRKYIAKVKKELDLLDCFTRARRTFRNTHLENIACYAVEKDWRASKWLLSITEPQHFSEKMRLEHTGEGGGPVPIEIIKHYEGKEKK